MEGPQLFNRYAGCYEDTVNAAITLSGETVTHFADLKAALLRRALGLSAEPRILDFGCGTGSSSRALGRVFTRSTIVGVDPSELSIETARAWPSDEGNLRYKVSTSDGLPFGRNEFDVVFTACVFHHIARKDHQKWLQEIRRVLAPGGALFVFEHNPHNPLTRKSVRDCPFDEGVELLEPSYTRSLLTSAGFEPSRPHFYFFFPAALRALRPLERIISWLPLGAQYFVRAECRAA